mmetsp:Transcript_14391/g.12894  ORF Transcript_14391/g.12894 Transcript_14391/m.12894 type:complete len:468 (-) Transcript_14391:263-1666(-)
MSIYLTILSLLTINETFAWSWYKPEPAYKPDSINPHGNYKPSEKKDLTCPFTLKATPISGDDPTIPDLYTYNYELPKLNINDVFQDIVDLLVDSQDCWPADTINGDTNYGGLFIRLAWHCSGTYRHTDGAGGCAGGRQRYGPEASWEDNTNLDKARALLYPIKEKYGDALSWGDLFVFAGTASIHALGGPVNEICAGRIDDIDGSKSNVLGFDHEPLTADPPCLDQGNCNEENDIIGASTVGLIYVNPEGVNGIPDPEPSAHRIREIFDRMDMNDTETVALIGGGHAFGKAHGACLLGAGPNPEEQPRNPWPGKCDGNPNYEIGRGKNTFTSGIEGPWTTHPFQWDNQFFTLLRDHAMDYELITGPGGAKYWINNGLMMLTTDLALYYDDEYRQIVLNFANNGHELDRHFAAAWEKLTTDGGEWAENKHCINGHELDLDLDEMPMRKDYHNERGNEEKESKKIRKIW